MKKLFSRTLLKEKLFKKKFIKLREFFPPAQTFDKKREKIKEI